MSPHELKNSHLLPLTYSYQRQYGEFRSVRVKNIILEKYKGDYYLIDSQKLTLKKASISELTTTYSILLEELERIPQIKN